MTELVVWNGCQWPADRLPAGVELADCVPVDDWFAQQRTNGKADKPPSKPKSKRRAKRSASED